MVERVNQTGHTERQFKNFTNCVIGRGLQVPENNVVFFGHRISHRGKLERVATVDSDSVLTMLLAVVCSCLGLVKLLVCVGTCRPKLTHTMNEPGLDSRMVSDVESQLSRISLKGKHNLSN